MNFKEQWSKTQVYITEIQEGKMIVVNAIAVEQMCRKLDHHKEVGMLGSLEW